MITEFSAALNQLANERGISKDEVIEAIKKALKAAYNKDFAEDDIEKENLEVEIDSNSGEVSILEEGKDVTPPGFGRIAAQTAKQVILQQVRKSEISSVTKEFKKKEGTIIRGNVIRIDGSVVVVDLGRVQGILPKSEQIPQERYRTEMNLKTLIKSVKETERGSEILLSRADPEFVRVLFRQEVPEIESGTVEIKNIVREAGSRTKMSVVSHEKNVDPVGACVGHKGVRVQNVLEELSGEKVDIVPYDPDIRKYIANALSPARVTQIKTDREERKAVVQVPEDQQSLAIGKNGQNVRLAHKLTEWTIDIEGVDIDEVVKEISEEEKEKDDYSPDRKTNLKVLDLDRRIEKSLKKAGINNVEELKELDRGDLLEIEGIGSKSAEKILKVLPLH